MVRLTVPARSKLVCLVRSTNSTANNILLVDSQADIEHWIRAVGFALEPWSIVFGPQKLTLQLRCLTLGSLRKRLNKMLMPAGFEAVYQNHGWQFRELTAHERVTAIIKKAAKRGRP